MELFAGRSGSALATMSAESCVLCEDGAPCTARDGEGGELMRAALSMVCVCAHGRQPGVISGCQGMNVLLIIRMQTGVLLCSHEHKVVAMYMRWLAAYWR